MRLKFLLYLVETDQINSWIKEIVLQRNFLTKELSALPFVKQVYESDSNFLLVKVNDANRLYEHLARNKVVVRNRSKEVLCDNCLRITIGTPEENSELLKFLLSYE